MSHLLAFIQITDKYGQQMTVNWINDKKTIFTFKMLIQGVNAFA